MTVGVGLDEVAGGVGRIGEVSDVVAVDAHIALCLYSCAVLLASTTHPACKVHTSVFYGLLGVRLIHNLAKFWTYKRYALYSSLTAMR